MAHRAVANKTNVGFLIKNIGPASFAGGETIDQACVRKEPGLPLDHAG
jgi:hypothetical protein